MIALDLAGVAVVAARVSGLGVDETLDAIDLAAVDSILDTANACPTVEEAAAMILHGFITRRVFPPAVTPVALLATAQLLALNELAIRDETLGRLLAQIESGDADLSDVSRWLCHHLVDGDNEDPAPLAVSGRIGLPGSHTLEAFMATGGYGALRRAVTTMTPAEVHEEVRASGLTGRSGGAAFPSASKWDTLPGSGPRFLVINGDESEPGFFKDHMLLESDPHQLVEGALLCAYAIGAHQVFVYIRGELALAHERVADAVNDAYSTGAAGERMFGSDFGCDIVVHAGAGAYIVGEETALLESLEGKRGFPRIKPPHPSAAGLYGLPTIVNNVETLSTLPWIVEHGGQAYARRGGGRFPGTRLFCLSGRIRRPGTYEVELHGPTFRDLLYSPAFGGGIPHDGDLTAFIPGASFPWLFPEQLDLHLDGDDVSASGSSLGSGILVLDHTVCPVRVAWRLARFFAHESCGQCTPCREGTSWLSKILQRIETGSGRLEDLDLLLEVGSNISPGPFPHPPRPDLGLPAEPFPYRQTTICPLGPSSVSAVDSSVFHFRDDYLAHIRTGSCPYKSATAHRFELPPQPATT